MKPVLCIIDIDIICGQDELARERLLEHLDRFKEPTVKVLWLNWLRERADLRLICLVYDIEQLDDFLVDVIRTVPGVRGAAAQLSFDGVIHGEALMDVSLLDSGWDRRAAAAVQVKLQPGTERAAYHALLALPPHQQVSVIWVVKLFHSADTDLLMLLLGDRTAALTGYVMSWIRTVPGVIDTQMSTVQDWRILGATEDFIALAQRFPEPDAA